MKDTYLICEDKIFTLIMLMIIEKHVWWLLLGWSSFKWESLSLNRKGCSLLMRMIYCFLKWSCFRARRWSLLDFITLEITVPSICFSLFCRLGLLLGFQLFPSWCDLDFEILWVVLFCRHIDEGLGGLLMRTVETQVLATVNCCYLLLWFCQDQGLFL